MNRNSRWVGLSLLAGMMLVLSVAQAAPPSMSAARVIQPQVSRPVGYRALLPTSTSQAAASKVFARSLAAGNRWNAKVHEAMGQYCAIRALQSGNSAIFALSPFYGMSADYHQRMASRCRNIVDKLDQ